MVPLQSEAIALRILALRGQRVILDQDLAALYDVPTGHFNQAVKRNAEKFPADFMFRLTTEEFANLKSQIVISSLGHGGRRHPPLAFTEHGALMAATILNAPSAVEVSVYVVRAFVQLRGVAVEHADLAKRLQELEGKTEALAMQHDAFSHSTRTQLKHAATRSAQAPDRVRDAVATNERHPRQAALSRLSPADSPNPVPSPSTRRQCRSAGTSPARWP
jgi:hypothetical protein